MKYEKLLAARYIRAQKRQSAFTVVSIIAAVAIMTMIFVLYGVFMDCLKNTSYSSSPYHLSISGLTAEQGEALQNETAVRSVKLQQTQNGTVTANILFADDIGDGEKWLQNAAEKIGAGKQWEKDNYQWNNLLLMLDGIGDGARLSRLRIFCAFFIAALLIAFALRLMIDTAFEISSKERERHYGVLQSIGATPEQIVRIITAEGMRLCVTAVPFGLLFGIVLAYVMYYAVLAAGLSDLFRGMTTAKLYLPFTIDWRMLLVSAAAGTGWVFLSAYGVGMRVIRKTPMEAITTRADEVKKVKRHTLSGLLFGVSGSLASRNARRQKKRFFITVLALTLSFTMFAVFTTFAETVERSLTGFLTGMLYGVNADVDFSAMLYTDPDSGKTYEDSAKVLADSGLFKNIGISVTEQIQLAEYKSGHMIRYVSEEEYRRLFGSEAPVSYAELARSGGYLINLHGQESDLLVSARKDDTLSILTIEKSGLRQEQDAETVKRAKHPHEITVLGQTDTQGLLNDGASLIGTMETFQEVGREWFADAGNDVFCTFSLLKDDAYNSAAYREASEWFKEHQNTVEIWNDTYGTNLTIHNVLSAARAGVLMLNVLIALTALINLLNIISTGIANRRSELASLQCIGMTDRQLERMTVIECLQFAGAAAFCSAILCALILFGTEAGLTALFRTSLTGGESKVYVQMLYDLAHPDRVTPFVRIALASVTAFAAGCITSLVMLRVQNTESLSDQIRGSEMQLDTKKSHLLRNSIIAVAGAFVLVIAGLRIYSAAAYHHDRNEYEKAGYLNLVDAGGCQMNVYSTGAANGKHKIVGLAGMGCHAFPVEAEQLNALLGTENTLIYPDHAGYGFSGDSLKPQTVEQVVSDYRTGLQNAGFAAPYVLMGHSYGGLYALYWAMQYPDEIEAVIMLDGTFPPPSDLWEYYTVDEFPSEKAARASGRRMILRTWLGLERLFPLEEGNGVPMGASLLSAEQLRLIALCGNRLFSAAFISEVILDKQEVTKMSEILRSTDIPKLYFSTLYTCEADIRASLERQKADYEAAGKPSGIDPETNAKAEWAKHGWEYEEIYRNQLVPFMDQIGNCRLEMVQGDHGIFYAQQPEQIAGSILDFLAETDA